MQHLSNGEAEDVTVGGVTRRVTVGQPTPKAPADWDHIRGAAAMAATVAVVAGALAWSTYAIGTLLSGLAPAPLAYSIAAAFDLAWIVTGEREYKLRFQPARTRRLKAFGWLLLAGSAAVVFIHGLAVSTFVVAACGATLSLLAKVLWYIRVHSGRRPMDPRIQAWVDATIDEGDAALLAAVVQRQANRARSRVARELAALDVQPSAHVHAPLNPLVQLEGPHVQDDAAHDTHQDTPPPGERRQALFHLLSTLPVADERSQSELARDLGSQVGLTWGSARNAIRDWEKANASAAKATPEGDPE